MARTSEYSQGSVQAPFLVLLGFLHRPFFQSQGLVPMYTLTTPRFLLLVLSFRVMYATTYQPLKFNKHRRELCSLSFHSPVPAPSVLPSVVK